MSSMIMKCSACNGGALSFKHPGLFVPSSGSRPVSCSRSKKPVTVLQGQHPSPRRNQGQLNMRCRRLEEQGIVSRFLGYVCVQLNEDACAPVCRLCLCRESLRRAPGPGMSSLAVGAGPAPGGTVRGGAVCCCEIVSVAICPRRGPTHSPWHSDPIQAKSSLLQLYPLDWTRLEELAGAACLCLRFLEACQSNRCPSDPR